MSSSTAGGVVRQRQLSSSSSTAASFDHPSSPTSTTLPPLSTSTIIRKEKESKEYDLRHLFENTTIEKILEIQKKLVHDIEKKKEDMRVLVGERYRDLIDAADTIGIMRTNSYQIHEQLTSLRIKLSSFPSLSKTTLLGHAEHGSTSEREKSPTLKSQELEIACKLKLSQEIPRQIQLGLEKGNLIDALHYYLLYTKKISDVLTNYKWAFLAEDSSDSLYNNEAKMKESILNVCNEAMEDYNSSSEKLTECMIIKCVLNSCSCETTLKEFINCRVAACGQILKNGEDSPQDKLTAACHERFIQYVSKTLLSIYQIFIEPEIYNNTSKIIRQPKISSLQLGISSCNPTCIQEFNNERIFFEEPPRIGKLTEMILHLYIPPLKTLLEQSYAANQYLHSFKTLQELMAYKNVSCTLLQSECDNFGRILFGSHLKNLWNELFQSILHIKCQAIIFENVETIFKLFADDEIYAKFKEADVDFNFVQFLWKQTESSSSSSINNNNEIELLKLKCLTPNIASFCAELEILLGNLLEDFEFVTPSSVSASSNHNGSSTSTTTTFTALKEYMSNTILHHFQQFLTSSPDHSLFLARFLTSTFDLCPTLWKILDKSDVLNLKQLLWNHSEACWKSWAEAALQSFQSDFKSKIPKLQPKIIIELMPLGEVYKSNMEGGQQQQQDFTPSILVPIQLSHLLHSNLYNFCLVLANVGPQIIPKSVRDYMRQALGQLIIDYYEKLINNQTDMVQNSENPESPSSSSMNNSLISSQVAIQFIFDLKFIQWFHPKLGTGHGVIEGLLAKLQGLIDPFDWDIVGSRLNLNLKRFLFENHLTLGLLFSEESQTFIAQNFKTKQNQAYPVSKRGGAPLPLLPI